MLPINPALVPVKVGEKIAFPDIIDNPSALKDAQDNKTVEADFPEHEYAGKYGVVRAVGYFENDVAFDVHVIDPSTGRLEGSIITQRNEPIVIDGVEYPHIVEDVDESACELVRVRLGEIQ